MNWKKYVLCALSVLLGAYIIIFQSHHFDTRNIVYWGYAFYFGGVAVPSYYYTKSHPVHSKSQKLIYNAVGWGIAVILIAGIIMGQTHYYEWHLKNYGKRGTARVNRVYTERIRYHSYREVCFYFSYRGKTYQQVVEDNELNEGDTVGIIFSTKDPEILDLLY